MHLLAFQDPHLVPNLQGCLVNEVPEEGGHGFDLPSHFSPFTASTKLVTEDRAEELSSTFCLTSTATRHRKH